MGGRAVRIVVAYFLLPSLPVAAHEIVTTALTWSAEISRMFQKHCIACHRGGGAAPMPLEQFEEARPWAKAIKEEVLERRMPPWGAVKGFGDLEPDHALPQEEILKIAEWVEGGAPEGDRRLLPPPARRSPPGKPVTPAGLDVHGSLTLRKALTVSGVFPLESADYAEVIAFLPGGRAMPLVCLHRYKHEWRRTFYLKRAILLPRGSRITVEPPSSIRLVPATRAGRRTR